MPRKNLSINPHHTIPFRSSNLAIPPSPFTPRIPLTLPTTLPKPVRSNSGVSKRISHLPLPPRAPLKWIWQCHLCHRQYRLGVTRRCLDDGHYFCSGTTTTRRGDGGRRVKKHQACGSEFDYSGWKVWDTWRRAVHTQLLLEAAVSPPSSSSSASSVLSISQCSFSSDSDSDSDVEMYDAPASSSEEEEDFMTASAVSPLFSSPTSKSSPRWFRSKTTTTSTPPKPPAPPKKDCWNNCDYPSECRWGSAYGVPTPASATFPFVVPTSLSSVITTLEDKEERGKEGKRDGGMGDLKDITMLEQQSVADTIDGVAIAPESTSSSSSSSSCAASSASARSKVSLTISTSTSSTPISSARETVVGGVGEQSAFTDLAKLVQSAQRRKSRREGVGGSPLASTVSSSSSLSNLTSSCTASQSIEATGTVDDDVEMSNAPLTTTSKFTELGLEKNGR